MMAMKRSVWDMILKVVIAVAGTPCHGNMRATLSGREFLSIVILFKKLLYIKEYEKKTTISICFSGNIQFQLYRSATNTY